MRLWGTPLEPFKGESGYAGGFQLRWLIQGHGVCMMLSKGEIVARCIDGMRDTFSAATEAHHGLLPVYRIEPSRQFKSKHQPDMLFAPMFSLHGWMPRSEQVFGKRLVPAPVPVLVQDPTFAPPSVATDKLFDAVTMAPTEVLPPETARQQVQQKRGRGRALKHDTPNQQVDPDLNDELPF